MVFFLYSKPEHARFFLEYINKKHKNMRFSIESEINWSLFLDVKLFRETKSLLLVFFRKTTSDGVYTNFISFIALEYKIGLLNILLNRGFFLFLLNFWNSIMKLIKLGKFSPKMQIYEGLSINAFKNTLITCYSKAKNSYCT